MTTESNTVHKFETAGLGKAPFRFLGVREHVFQACPGEPTKPGTSCDYCASSLRFACHFLSADGKEFKVGCDCAQSAGDKGMQKRIASWQKKHDKALRDAAKARKAAAVVEAHGDLLQGLDDMAEAEGFIGSFAKSVARQIRNGKAPTEKQLAVLSRAA
jgi:hypothetical protein